jgi:hypothetical protein
MLLSFVAGRTEYLGPRLADLLTVPGSPANGIRASSAPPLAVLVVGAHVSEDPSR